MAMIETVSVVRPLKVIALICLIVATILLIVALATSTWIKADNSYRTGLFESCTGQGCALASSGYVKATAALLIIAGLITLVAIVFTIFGLLTNSTNRKYLSYRIAMYIAFVAVVLELVALIVFPVCFYLGLKDWNSPYSSWDFDWSYGVAWGTTFFTFGAALLLLCDKEADEIYYKEKTIYTPAAKEAPA